MSHDSQDCENTRSFKKALASAEKVWMTIIEKMIKENKMNKKVGEHEIKKVDEERRCAEVKFSDQVMSLLNNLGLNFKQGRPDFSVAVKNLMKKYGKEKECHNVTNVYWGNSLKKMLLEIRRSSVIVAEEGGLAMLSCVLNFSRILLSLEKREFRKGRIALSRRIREIYREKGKLANIAFLDDGKLIHIKISVGQKGKPGYQDVKFSYHKYPEVGYWTGRVKGIIGYAKSTS